LTVYLPYPSICDYDTILLLLTPTADAPCTMKLMSGVRTDHPDTTITTIQHNNKEEALLN
jgi:hypothetical protein